MITLDQYFGAKPHSAEQAEAATDLLARVNSLLEEYDAKCASAQFAEVRELCPNTGTEIAGSWQGAGDGGFRAPDSKTGAASSKHRTAHAVDVYDPYGKLDDYTTDEVLEVHGLWKERSEITPGWCHLQNVVTLTGKRAS